ncbi:hypothetical protein ILUMI_25361 [Ignelater luminosus]|uniref:Uncharacterized protein n=1 Tax=Ignelater luminosus TaxID=2038154 RepID=A0A8K0C7I4_IGNLU|nr:hypothetical protein ILUMI_25361 [Ignelater luminosus]
MSPHTSHTVFGPYKTFYNNCLNDWMISNPATICDSGGIIGKAFDKAFTTENIKKGFVVTGICPLDKNVFLSNFVTDKLSEETMLSISSSSSEVGIIKSPELVRPFPKAPPQKIKGRGWRRRRKTRILIDSSEKEEIETNQTKKLKAVSKGKDNIQARNTKWWKLNESTLEDESDIPLADTGNDNMKTLMEKN